MSLLLDALKRAEDAKRLKRSEALNGDLLGHDEPSDTALTLDNADQLAVTVLSLEEMHAETKLPTTSSESIAGIFTETSAKTTLIDPTGAARSFSLVDDVVPPALVAAPSPTATSTASRAGRVDKPSALLRATGATSAVSNRTANSAPADWSESDIADIAKIEAEQQAKQSAQQRDQRDAAKNIFAAKKNVQSASATASKTKWLLPLIALLVVGIGGGAWYVWNEVNKVSQPSWQQTASSRAALPQPSLSKVQPSGAVLTPSVATAVVASTTAPATSAATGITSPAEPASVDAALPPLLPPPAKEMPLPKLVSAPTVKKLFEGESLTERELLAKRLQASSGAKSAIEAPVSLKLSQTIDVPKVNPTLLAAYTALSKGDYAEAKKRYGDVVRAEPYSLDAQLGLATAAARTGDNATAAKFYRQALALDPRNGTALSGLIAVSGEVPSDTLETELKTWVVKNPNSAPLQFSLGNLYAGQRRWTEAQQAYFDAYRIDSVNADYLYNLAVSLDQLNQFKLALDYYQKALAQLGRSGGQFDRASVVRRVGELKANPKAN